MSTNVNAESLQQRCNETHSVQLAALSQLAATALQTPKCRNLRRNNLTIIIFSVNVSEFCDKTEHIQHLFALNSE